MHLTKPVSYTHLQAIRYGMAAVKGIGKPVMEAIVEERSANGPFRSLKDFAERLSGKEVNKRTVENFIKAGAFDCFGVTRKQLMFVYANVLDDVAREKKDSLSGQMSLFDFVDETTKRSYETVYPDVGEYEKSDLLALEKEVLGIYVSGHPLEEQEECWRKNISAVATYFQPDEAVSYTHLDVYKRQVFILGRPGKQARRNAFFCRSNRCRKEQKREMSWKYFCTAIPATV